MHEGENKNDLVLAPSAFFKVMVDGRHFEKSFSVCELKVKDLQHGGKQLNDINCTNEEKQERLFHLEESAHNDGSQKQRARVSHKHLCWVEVVKQKAKGRTNDGAAYNAKSYIPCVKGEYCKENAYDVGDRGCKSVKSVGEVRAVDNAN